MNVVISLIDSYNVIFTASEVRHRTGNVRHVVTPTMEMPGQIHANAEKSLAGSRAGVRAVCGE